MKKRFPLICMPIILLSFLVIQSAFAAGVQEIKEPTSAEYTKTSSGNKMAYKYDGVENYLGIKYGVAERFQLPSAYAPERPTNMNAMVIGEVAPQRTYKSTVNRFDTMNYSHDKVENEFECLNLNIWTTDSTKDKNMPVIVWLHGGGFSSGSSVEYTFYEGANLAKSGNIVFVSVNHRLNVLGYLDVSAYGGHEYKYSGNVGMADIVLALEWVRDNISAFGGDPDNVTIIGQSGGGAKVSTLMGMPAAKGLFTKAASLSGGSVTTRKTSEQAQQETSALVEYLGLSDLPPEEILNALVTIPYIELKDACDAAKVTYGPVVDGDYYPDGTYKMSRDIPYMCGNVLGEFSTNYGRVAISFDEEAYYAGELNSMTAEQTAAKYRQKYGDYADAIMAAFKEAYPTHNVADGLYVNIRYGEDFFNGANLAAEMVKYGGTAYNYVAAYNYPMFGSIVPIHTASGIPFWFNNIDDVLEWVAGDEENAQKVADAMSGALVSLAYNGSPSTEALPWESYTPESGACMVFDVESKIRYNHDTEFFRLITEAKAKK